MKTSNELLLTQNKLDISKKLNKRYSSVSFLIFSDYILVSFILWSIPMPLKMKLTLFSVSHTTHPVLAKI